MRIYIRNLKCALLGHRTTVVITSGAGAGRRPSFPVAAWCPCGLRLKQRKTAKGTIRVSCRRYWGPADMEEFRRVFAETARQDGVAA